MHIYQIFLGIYPYVIVKAEPRVDGKNIWEIFEIWKGEPDQERTHLSRNEYAPK